MCFRASHKSNTQAHPLPPYDEYTDDQYTYEFTLVSTHFSVRQAVSKYSLVYKIVYTLVSKYSLMLYV